MKVGDLVVFRGSTEGPVMIITERWGGKPDGIPTCHWMNNGEWRFACIPDVALQLANREPEEDEEWAKKHNTFAHRVTLLLDANRRTIPGWGQKEKAYALDLIMEIREEEGL